MDLNHASEVHLKFYGCIVRVVSTDQRCVENAQRDFSYFLCPPPPAGTRSVTLRLRREAPPKTPAQARRVFRTREAVCYDYRRVRYVDYSGKALVRYDFDSEEGAVFSLDDDLLHEISYLMILSRIGELLDKKGIHCIHSLAVSVNGSAAICLLPMGGGKTMLALELVKERDCLLLSDEIAAIDKQLRVLPFPLRIGVRQAERVTREIPARYLRSYRTITFGSKTLIDVDYFIEKIAREPAALRVAMLGERTRTGRPALKRVSRFMTLIHVLRDITLAYQLPRTKAYLLRFDAGYLRAVCAIYLSRVLTGVRLAMSAEWYRFSLAEHPHENAKLIANFFREKKGESE